LSAIRSHGVKPAAFVLAFAIGASPAVAASCVDLGEPLSFQNHAAKVVLDRPTRIFAELDFTKADSGVPETANLRIGARYRCPVFPILQSGLLRLGCGQTFKPGAYQIAIETRRYAGTALRSLRLCAADGAISANDVARWN
jgi:hypothetical protein